MHVHSSSHSLADRVQCIRASSIRCWSFFHVEELIFLSRLQIIVWFIAKLSIVKTGKTNWKRKDWTLMVAMAIVEGRSSLIPLKWMFLCWVSFNHLHQLCFVGAEEGTQRIPSFHLHCHSITLEFYYNLFAGICKKIASIYYYFLLFLPLPSSILFWCCSWFVAYPLSCSIIVAQLR